MAGALFAVGALALGVGLAWRAGVLRRLGQLLITLGVAELLLIAALPEPPEARRGPAYARFEVGGTGLGATMFQPDLRPRTEAWTLAFVGDSFTRGFGVADGDAFPERVVATLGGRARGLNLGIIDASFDEEVGVWWTFGRLHAPDVLVWVFVLNDLDLRRFGEDALVMAEPLRPTGVRLVDLPRRALAQRRLSRVTSEAYRASLDPVLNPDAFDRLDRGLEATAYDARTAGVRPLFVVFPLLWQLDAYPFAEAHRVIAAHAEAAGWEVLDLLPAFAGKDASELWVSGSDHHPNERAHQIAAEAITDRLAGAERYRAQLPDCVMVPPRLEAQAAPIRARCERPDDPALALALAQAFAADARWEGLVRLHALDAVMLAQHHGDGVVEAQARSLLLGRGRMLR